MLDRSSVAPPLDLTIGTPANVTWSAGQLTINTETLIASTGAATKVIDAIKAADAFTFEAWMAPSATEAYLQRVVTLSTTNSDLAATLMSTDTHFEFRMRGAMTDSNGLPSLSTTTGTIALAPMHVVLTSAANGERKIYIDGALRASDTLGGDLDSWGTGHRLGLADEIDGGRAWFGTFDLVAIYARALTLEQVQQNRAAGPL